MNHKINKHSDDILAEGYKAMGAEDIELAEQFLNISKDIIPCWEVKEFGVNNR
jgi:hypothetical protein